MKEKKFTFKDNLETNHTRYRASKRVTVGFILSALLSATCRDPLGPQPGFDVIGLHDWSDVVDLTAVADPRTKRLVA